MLTRRSFLTRIFGGLAATAIVAALPKSVQAIADAPVEVTDPLVMEPTFTGALDYLFHCFKNERERLGWPLDPSRCFDKTVMLGEILPNGLMCKHQLHVGFDREQMHALPAAQALARSSVRYGVEDFGSLPLPMGCHYAGTHGPLRLCVHQYGIRCDVMVVRADIIGASTPASLDRAKREEYRITAIETKRRLLAKHGQAMTRLTRTPPRD